MCRIQSFEMRDVSRDRVHPSFSFQLEFLFVVQLRVVAGRMVLLTCSSEVVGRERFPQLVAEMALRFVVCQSNLLISLCWRCLDVVVSHEAQKRESVVGVVGV